jgi:hypothetical protein
MSEVYIYERKLALIGHMIVISLISSELPVIYYRGFHLTHKMHFLGQKLLDADTEKSAYN